MHTKHTETLIDTFNHKAKTIFRGICFYKNVKKNKTIFISKMKTTTFYRVTFLPFLLTNSYDTHILLKPTVQYRPVPLNGTCGRWIDHKAK
jgi:hypothetical protein